MELLRRPLLSPLTRGRVGWIRDWAAMNGIVVWSNGRGTLWLPVWTTVAQYPDPRIWAVSYVGAGTRSLKANAKPVDTAREGLAQALTTISEFTAGSSNLASWTETFDKAAGILHASQPVAPYHPDILPPDGYPLAARQLLAASVAAFVFGGMGSWNDCGFKDRAMQARYESVTRQLYSAVMDGLASAVQADLHAGR